MSAKKRTAVYENTQRRSVIDPEITTRDTLLISRAVIRVTLITTLSNILLLTKEIKTMI